MKENSKLNHFPVRKKSINKKITDSLQSKKRVSWGISTKKDLGRESLSDMEICEAEPQPESKPKITEKRSISQLFSEFSLSTANSSLSIPNFSYSYNTSIPAQPTPKILAPVLEESESNQSSGHNSNKKIIAQDAGQKSKQFNKATGLDDLKKLVWAKNKGNFSGLNENCRLVEGDSKQQSLQHWRNQLENSRKAFFEFEKECFRVLTIAECVETKLEILISSNKQKEPDKPLLSLQDFHKDIDFSTSPYKSDERWVKTWTKLDIGNVFTYFRHLGSYYLNEILSKLVISVCRTSANKIFIDYELFQCFNCQDLNKIWEGFKNFFIKLLTDLSIDEILEKSSRAWVNFVEFSDKFEVFKISFDYDNLYILDRCFKLNGSVYGKRWEYLCTFYNLIEGVDILEEISKVIQDSTGVKT